MNQNNLEERFQESRILIVDDDPISRETLEDILYAQKYKLTFAENGIDSIKKVEENPPDLILMDIMMPKMNGIEACRKLKSDDKNKHIPIILVTALDSKDDMVKGLDAGADDFLTKPVNRIELRARVRSMLRIKKQYDDLMLALQMREDLSNLIVHDIRNILNIITMSSYILKFQNIDDRDGFQRSVDIIQNQTRRMDNFLDDILMLAKMKEGKMILKTSEVELNELIGNVAKNHSPVAESKGLKIELDLPKESKKLHVDPNLFERVLDNLVSNALKHSPWESVITLKAERRENDKVRINIMDQGEGIPEEYRNRIFNKFEIVNLKKKGVRQIGLGLAFCKMVVEAHDGKIWVEDNDPVGSIFKIEI